MAIHLLKRTRSHFSLCNLQNSFYYYLSLAVKTPTKRGDLMAQEGFKRKLTAILSADAEGYSRLMGEDEEATVRTLTAYREVMTSLIQQHNGKVLDSPGDNLLAEFVSVVDAVQCAVAVQKEINARNTELPENRKMQFRIGINLGDVIQEEERIYGDGVNIAARLEGLAEPREAFASPRPLLIKLKASCRTDMSF